MRFYCVLTSFLETASYLEKTVKLRHVTEILKTIDAFHFQKKTLQWSCLWQTAIFLSQPSAENFYKPSRDRTFVRQFAGKPARQKIWLSTNVLNSVTCIGCNVNVGSVFSLYYDKRYGKAFLHINHHNSIYFIHYDYGLPLRTCNFLKSQWFKMPDLVRQSESMWSVAVL